MTQVPVTHKINLNFLHLQSSSMLLCLCKLCVLLFALLATFRTILFLKFRTKTPSISPQVTEYDYSDDDDDETCSLSSTSSESEDDDEEIEEENRTGEYFRFRGCDCDSSYDGGIVSVYGDDERLSASAAVMDSTGENASGNLGLRSWDTGVRRRMTAVIAEWAPGIGNSAGVISGGVRKVYVREDGRYEFGDMRNVTSSPLEYVTESQLDLWWPNPYMLNI